MSNMLFIYNPHTGGGKLKSKLMDILCLFSDAGYADITVHPTTARGDAYDCARRLGASHDLVVCCGGDGTLNEVVGGLLCHNPVPRLGYIPGGTTNDFASSLMLPKSDLMAAARRIVQPKKLFHTDVGQLGERTFNYVAAFGAFTDISYKTPQRFKNVLGYFAYILEAVQTLGHLTPCHARITCSDGVYEGDWLFGIIANSTSVGGFSYPNTKGRVKLNDGQFEVLLVHHPQSLADLRALSTALLSKDPTCPHLTTLRLGEGQFEAEEDTAWTLDGEFGGEMKLADIKVHQQILPILV